MFSNTGTQATENNQDSRAWQYYWLMTVLLAEMTPGRDSMKVLLRRAVKIRIGAIWSNFSVVFDLERKEW